MEKEKPGAVLFVIMNYSETREEGRGNHTREELKRGRERERSSPLILI